MAKQLKTTSAVIHALGGFRATANLTGRKYTACWNWKERESFPPDTYLVMITALTDLGCEASPALWRMSRAVAPEEQVAT